MTVRFRHGRRARLLVALVATISVAAPATATSAAAPAAVGGLPAAIGHGNISQAGLLSAHNRERAAAGAGALSLNANLNSAAQIRANEMIANAYFAHRRPNGAGVGTVFSEVGYSWTAWGENLFMGVNDLTNQGAVNAWMNSEGHRRNLLSGNYIHVGFGYASTTNFGGQGPRTIIVALFGRSNTNNPPPPTNPPPPSGPDWVDVKPGDSGARVAIVQSFLRRAGFAVNGDYDGVYSAATTRAVWAFQMANNIPITGGINRATAIALGLWPRDTRVVAGTGEAVTPPTTPVAPTPVPSTTTPVPSTTAPAVPSVPTTVPPPVSTTPVVPTTIPVPPTTSPATTEPLPVDSTLPEEDPDGVDVGDLVWHDANGDGIQQPGEPGVDGATLRILDADGNLLAETATDRHGKYRFTDVLPGTYVVELELPNGFEPTIARSGADSRLDSDFISASVDRARTSITVTDGAQSDLDAGLVPTVAPPTEPPVPTEPVPSSEPVDTTAAPTPTSEPAELTEPAATSSAPVPTTLPPGTLG